MLQLVLLTGAFAAFAAFVVLGVSEALAVDGPAGRARYGTDRPAKTLRTQLLGICVALPGRVCDAHLVGADPVGADVSDANLTEADIARRDTRNAELAGARGIPLMGRS